MNMDDYKKVTDRIEPNERCREEIFNMSRKDKKQIRLSKKAIGAIIAAAVVACGGTAAVAAGQIGVLSRVNDNLNVNYVDNEGNEFKKDKYEHHDYVQINEHAQEFTEPLVFEGENVSVTVESVYCDNDSLILGLSGSMNDGNIDNNQYIYFDFLINKDGKEFSFESGEDIPFERRIGVVSYNSKMYLDEGTQNTFSGMLQITFNQGYGFTDPTDVDISMYNFIPNSSWYGEAVSSEAEITDRFDFSLNVSPDYSLVRNINTTFTDSDGYFITIYDITPVGMKLDAWYISEDDKIPYMQEHPLAKMYAVYTDGNGKELESLEFYEWYKVGDKSAYFLQPPTSDIINIKYYDCNGEYDENGEPVLVHEMTIDLENLTVIE